MNKRDSLSMDQLLLVARQVTGWRCVIRDGNVWVYPPSAAYSQVFGPVLNRKDDSTGGSMTTYALMIIQWLAKRLTGPINDGDQPYTSVALFELADYIAKDDIRGLMHWVIELSEKRPQQAAPIDDQDPIDLEIFL
jgi:hypothetical protein